MPLGACILFNPNHNFTQILFDGFNSFGFITFIAVSSSHINDLNKLTIPQKSVVVYNQDIREILDKLVPLNVTYLITCNCTTDFGHPVINHTTFISEKDKLIRIIFEPNKSISRSYNISSDQTSWNPFIISCIETNSLPSLITFNDTTYVCKSPQQSFHKLLNKQFAKVVNVKAKSFIKPLWNFSYDSNMLIEKWSRFINSDDWKLVDSNQHFFLVINSAHQPIEPSRTFYFMMEPYGEKLYHQFIQSVRSQLFFYGCHKYHLNNCEWHIQSPRSDTALKPKGLTIIVSNKNMDIGQKYRLELVKQLDSMSDTLNFPIEIYGKCADLQFKNYKGELPECNKDIALNRYQYHFNAENNQIDNYITEKLYDSILCDCYTFYYGAKNTNKYFDMKSICELSGNVEEDIQTIIKQINMDVYLNSKESIAHNKNKICNVYSMNNRLTSIWETINSIVFIHNKENMNVQEIVKQCTDQSFKLVNIIQFQLNDPEMSWLFDLCKLSLQYFMNCIIVLEPITDLLFQTCSNSFALAKEGDVILQKLDIGTTNIIIRCSGCEQIILNYYKGLRGIKLFDGCKIGKICI